LAKLLGCVLRSKSRTISCQTSKTFAELAGFWSAIAHWLYKHEKWPTLRQTLEQDADIEHTFELLSDEDLLRDWNRRKPPIRLEIRSRWAHSLDQIITVYRNAQFCAWDVTESLWEIDGKPPIDPRMIKRLIDEMTPRKPFENYEELEKGMDTVPDSLSDWMLSHEDRTSVPRSLLFEKEPEDFLQRFDAFLQRAENTMLSWDAAEQAMMVFVSQQGRTYAPFALIDAHQNGHLNVIYPI
jgi:hypothetical protein